jgi:D-amino-acid dehydrogenase
MSAIRSKTESDRNAATDFLIRPRNQRDLPTPCADTRVDKGFSMTKTDILIIGGGPIGLSAAYYLLKSGRSVTLLDQATIGTGNAAGNAGQIVSSHIIPLAAPGVISTVLKWMLDPQNSPFGLKISLNPTYLRWLIQFAAACSETNIARAIPPLKELGLLSAHNFSTLIAAEGFDCSYRKTGLIALYKTPRAFDYGQREAEILLQYGLPAEVLNMTAVHESEPAVLPEVIGGVHFTADASLNPGEFLRLLAQRVHEMGADLHPNTLVTHLESTGEKITCVVTLHDEFEPAQVVLAAGVWSPLVARNLRLNIPVQSARGYSLTMKAPQTMPRQALLLDERKVAITPMGEKLRFTGRLEIGEMGRTSNPRWINAIERAAREYIHLDEKLDIQETWAGLRPTTPDGLPIIGFSPRYKNLLLATGHAMVGLSLGPGTGQIVAELANGAKPSFDLRPLSLERF